MKKIPFDSINICHSNAFKERDDQERVTSGKTVHQLKYVTASSMSEHNRYGDTRNT